MPIINETIVLDTSKMSNRMRTKFKNYKIISENLIEINSLELVKEFPNYGARSVRFICDRCGRERKASPRCLNSADGDVLCVSCKVSITVSSPECQKRTKETNMRKYGCEHVLSSPQVRKKIDNTNLERYGCKNPLQRKDVVDKIKADNKEKYGVEWASQREDCKEKSKKTCLERYGVEHVLSYKPLREKMEENNMKKYGVRINSQRESAKQKMIKTNQQKYGYDYTAQVPEIRKKQYETLLKKRKDVRMSSKPERHLLELFNGMPFHIENKFTFDIFLEKEKIDIEYDGGGHRLSVTAYHKFTDEEFDKKEQERDMFLASLNYKIIRFIAPRDALHDDNKMIELLNLAKGKLATCDLVKIFLEEDDRIECFTYKKPER